MQLVIGNTYESSRGFGRLLYLGETHDIDGYLPTFRTTKGDLKFYSYDQLPGALVEFAQATVSRADELIACLEGEIAKRDARIVELESCLNALESDVTRLREKNATFSAAWDELAAIKAQEPVAYIPVDRETGEEWHPVLKKGSGNICDYKPLYAAPVSEARVQGVYSTDPLACPGCASGCFRCASPAGADGLEVVGVLCISRFRNNPAMENVEFQLAADVAQGQHDLCRLSDAQAIIDGLRGEVGAQRIKTCTALKERNDARTERDQQAQRIGELEGLLREARDTYRAAIHWEDLRGTIKRIDAALSGQPK